MVVQEIFNLSAIKEIEEMILYHQWKIEHARGSYETNKKLIKRLIEIRQILLDREFVMNEYHKGLLGEFNDAMRAQLVKMRLETIKAYHVAEATGLGGEIEAIGKCYLGYRYSKFHPVQTIRAKKMWAVLNGTLDDYVDLYGDGVITNGWSYRGGEPESEDTMLYLDEKLDNWNNGFDREQTKDMHLVYAVHNLYDHMAFSIFDLLWVRDFNIEIHVEIDYNTCKEEVDYDDDALDWSERDFYECWTI